MKPNIKTLLLLLATNLYVHAASAQETWLTLVNGFNQIAEASEKLFSSFARMEENIDKKKVREMGVKLYADVSSLITAKQSIVVKIEKGAPNMNYTADINDIEQRLNALSATLQKYDALIVATGINAIDLRNTLKLDFFTKATSLDALQAKVKGTRTPEQFRQEITVYFKTCINILQHSQEVLSRFKG